MKRYLLGAMLALLLALALAGCSSGVSKAEMDKVKSDLSQAQTQLKDFTSEVDTAWNALAPKLDLVEFLVNYWATATTGDRDAIGRLTLGIATVVDRVGDAELTQLWQDAFALAAQGNTIEYAEKFSAMMRKATELARADTQAISEKITEYKSAGTP